MNSKIQYPNTPSCLSNKQEVGRRRWVVTKKSQEHEELRIKIHMCILKFIVVGQSANQKVLDALCWP